MDKKKGKLKWVMMRSVMGILLAATVVCDTLPVGSVAVSASENREVGLCSVEVMTATLPNLIVEDNAEKPKAQVEKDGEISYVADFFDAFAEENTGATVTLLEDVNLGEFNLRISEGTDFTLDLNGKTITGTSSLIAVDKGARLTIRDSDSGQLISPWECVVVDGELVLEGGSFFSSKTDGDSTGVGMFNKDASIEVTGPAVKIDSLVISFGKDISLTAGTYGSIVTNSSNPLASLLGEGHAYYRDGSPFSSPIWRVKQS